MSADWLQLLSTARHGAPEDQAPARSPFQRDYDRVLFSGAFRRLADKTQVFPLPYDDHVHSRLTHSLEVASIGRSLGTLVGGRVLARDPRLAGALDARDFGDCVAAACLAHDLGNPPFGHVGEDAIKEFFEVHRPLWDQLTPRQRADLLQFEGNAQTLRIVTRLERPSVGGGLQLTNATLGALVKYPCTSLVAHKKAPEKGAKKPGLFDSEIPMWVAVATALGLPRANEDQWQRHPLAFLTEAADDIAYLLLDWEDGRRLKQVPEPLFLEMLAPFCKDSPRCPDLAPDAGDYTSRMDRADQLRAIAVNTLVHDAADSFDQVCDGILAGSYVDELKATMKHQQAMNDLQGQCVKRCYQARDVLKMELAGAEAIQGLLTVFVNGILEPGSLRGSHLAKLYPSQFPKAGSGTPLSPYEQLQRLTDHISGMTDHYAVRLYRELRGMRYPGGRD